MTGNVEAGLMATQLRVPQKVVLSESTYDVLRNAILDGTLSPGTRIVEEALSRQLGVSRAPLREAMWLLKRDGLLVEESARTTRVVQLTEADVRELHMIRAVLETLAYQQAAPLLRDEHLAELDQIIAEMHDASLAGDARRIAHLDYAFHRTLCLVCELPRVRKLWDEQHVLFRLWLNMVGSSLGAQDIAHTHRVLLDVVRGGDAQAISEQVIEHVYLVGGVLAEQRQQWAAAQPRLCFPSAADVPAARRSDR
ncbi:GntR family transcriptional regulator [Micromonospora sp. NBC_01813]|uniref:GntR family transcriptional regulator n=1 Tax=Micromonospora sp. NBC_01813 TaxID=2975988 RepID=UPI002DDB1828|nr:GntR family transcriptional regulator [Micromonospora sp. NBC_01813]WSA07267.1 GntR family transcriptional regulator [Micromonospora sp. NBC_01813]